MQFKISFKLHNEANKKKIQSKQIFYFILIYICVQVIHFIKYTFNKSNNFKNMKKIFPILLIDRTLSSFNSLELRHGEFKYSGNGFFISNKGFFASVAHALISCENKIPYAFINDMFYKIDIKIFKHGFNDEVYEDFAIGKIDFDNKNWFDVDDFREVTENDELVLTGYSKFSNLTKGIEDFDFDCPANNFHILPLNKPLSMHYDYFNEKTSRLCKQTNSISVEFNTKIYFKTLSGSPIVNPHNHNEIFGLLKGAKKDEPKYGLQVYKIETLRKLIDEVLKK